MAAGTTRPSGQPADNSRDNVGKRGVSGGQWVCCVDLRRRASAVFLSPFPFVGSAFEIGATFPRPEWPLSSVLYVTVGT